MLHSLAKACLALLGALLYLEAREALVGQGTFGLGLSAAGCDKREGRSARGNSLCKGWETGKGLVSWRKLRG